MSEEENSGENHKTVISRREFLKDAGLVAGGIGGLGLMSSCSSKTITTTVTTSKNTIATIPTTPMAMTTTINTSAPNPPITTLTINGMQYKVQVEPQWTLQRTLQFKLGLTGSAKTMCDHGECGSCTVIINGRPVLSCLILAVECEGKSIQTIEGMAAANHPLIDSYIKFDVPQCGYCTPGFLVSAKALLDRNPKPTDDDIKQALAGNLCRCGTYMRHRTAVLDAAKKL